MKLKSKILITHFELQGRKRRIVVFVKDSKNKPIPHASVYVSGGLVGIKSRADDKGKCVIWVDENRKDLFVQAGVSMGINNFSTERNAFMTMLGDTNVTIIISNYHRDDII